MKHPLEFVVQTARKRRFFTFFLLTLVMFAIFRVLDQPLRTPAALNGIVSFELAGTPERAKQMVDSWSREAGMTAAFGLGLDYLFMPLYSLALAYGTLLAAGRHGGWLRLLGNVAGWGAFAAALFDAVENYALFNILLGAHETQYPAIAAVSAAIKFGLLIFGLAYSIAGGVLPRRTVG